MKVLVACEESGTVREAFRALGHDAWSNDLLQSEGVNHIQADCMDAIRLGGRWDLIIMHPPCTHLSLSGNRWYGKGTDGYHKRLEAVKWTSELWKLAKKHSPRVCLENPTSVIFPMMRKECEIQFVQPYEYGHPETKKTGLALHNLPPLVPTDLIPLPDKGSKEYIEWQRVWRMAPSAERQQMRSKTYDGIAKAMAKQWGCLDGD